VLEARDLVQGDGDGLVPPVDAVGLAPAVAALVPDVDGEPDDVLGDLGAGEQPACMRQDVVAVVALAVDPEGAPGAVAVGDAVGQHLRAATPGLGVRRDQVGEPLVAAPVDVLAPGVGEVAVGVPEADLPLDPVQIDRVALAEGVLAAVQGELHAATGGSRTERHGSSLGGLARRACA